MEKRKREKEIVNLQVVSWIPTFTITHNVDILRNNQSLKLLQKSMMDGWKSR